MRRLALLGATALWSGAAYADPPLPMVATPASIGAVARTAIDAFNVLNAPVPLIADCSTDNAAALRTILTAAAATSAATGGGKVDVTVPATGTCYGLYTSVAIPAGVRLVGLGKPTFTALGAAGGLFSSTAGRWEMRNLRLDSRNTINVAVSNPISITGATGDVLIDDVELVNPTGGISVTNSYGVRINRPIVTGSLQHGVLFTGTYDSAVILGRFQSEAGFGIILAGGSYRNLIEGNRTTSNGIELVGVTQDSYENRIAFNHSEGTGDNCYSITGYSNIVVGNIGKGCFGNGIELYGDRNTVTGNHLKNNAQHNSTNTGWRGGIAVQPGFGGTGQYNVIGLNDIDDDQATPTQLYGVWLGPTLYVPWATATVYAAGAYASNGGNLYKATTAGTSGATAPTWTDTESDGAVSWQYLRAFVAGTTAADYNEISSNMIERVGTARYLDASGGAHNEFVGGLVVAPTPNPLITAQVLNVGGVSAVALPGGGYNIPQSGLSGAVNTMTIAAPPAGGSQATANIVTLFLAGLGALNGVGAGCSVNDVLTLTGGTPVVGPVSLVASTSRTIKVLTIDGSGKPLTFTSGVSGSYYYSVPFPAAAVATTGGTCTTLPSLTGILWSIGAINLSSGGSGYTGVPAVTYAPALNGGTPSIASLAATLSLNAGASQVLLNATGTVLGTVGIAGLPVVSNSALVDGSGVRFTLTGTGYTVPVNTSLVRFVQGGTIATQTVTLPTVHLDGQPLQFVNYAGQLTALTFSPAVTGWTNASTLAANTGLRIRWDNTAAAWQREQ